MALHQRKRTANMTDQQLPSDAIWSRFAPLEEEIAPWTEEDLMQRHVVVQGQLMHTRRISRRCSFYDLQESAEAQSEAPGLALQRMEVILKIVAGVLTEEEVDSIRHGAHVGDVVHVRGILEKLTSIDGQSSLLLHARSITTVKPWKELHPGVPFVPVPTVHKGRAQQQKRSGADQQATVDISTAAKHDEQDETQEKPVMHCKFWINSRSCQYGDHCEFVHASDADVKVERAKWLQERLHLKRIRASQEDDPHDAHGKQGKQQRAQIFVDWLVSTFGREFLKSGSSVIDVAGGRGGISFELWNKRGVPCTLIDPRPMKLSREQHKFIKKQKKDKESVIRPLVPQKLALFNTTTFLEVEGHEELLRSASIVVGMHPDEATDSIVDTALKFNKPFAIVPCCVFGLDFPNRRLPDGGKVVSYEDLVAYLMAKDPSIQKTFLPFHGKNLVLYREHAAAATEAEAGDETMK